jgi:FlgD Ig-like domain
LSRTSFGAGIFFALLATALTVAVLVVRERDPDLALEVTAGLLQPRTLHPVGPQRPRELEFTFFVRESEDDALIAIVDSHEEIVRTLDRDVELSTGNEVTYGWDGRTDAGELAPVGRYRLLVELPDADREMVWPRRITLGSPPASLEPEEDDS